jgi:tRNA-specific 2-thiouridylase
MTPLGSLLKSEVRRKAEEMGISTANTPDSQNLCFNHLLPNFTRDVVKTNSSGVLVKIGTHSGRPAVGQRKGFGGMTVRSIDSAKVEVGTEPPLQNRVDVAWVQPPPDGNYNLVAQLAYHGNKYACEVIDETTVLLDRQVTVSPGQIIALYDGSELMAGGIIRK